MKAKAAIYLGANQPFEIREYELTPPKAGYAKLSLIASGVCGTDIHIHNGKLGGPGPKIIGHEFVGRIEEIAQEDAEQYGLKVGDAVISDIACPCGECLLCKTGDDANCVKMGVTNGGNPDDAPHFHGGYAEFSYAPVSNLIKIPEGVDPKMAAVFACPGPTGMHAFSLAKKAGVDLKSVQTAVVQGMGPVSTFAVSYLASLGIPNVLVVTANAEPEKVELTKKLGATQVFGLNKDGEEAIQEEIKKISGGLGADLVFEGSGSPVAVPFGMKILRNRGVYLIPGQYSNSGGIEIQPQMITFKALHIIGSSQYSFEDVRGYVKFLEENLGLHETISSLATCYPVADVNKAFAEAKARKNIKTVLTK
ncbi:MAG: alcohol dehydrogenase catalytic domain-containing protein [Clostridia bacterium]|nr:alcohol dehydrogenase catalytic domain-containing protein [Clostridia bacterium]